MAELHCYFGVEILSMTGAQRDTLVALLKSITPVRITGQPAHRNHWRIRLDGNAGIFEAMFNDANLSVQAFKNKLGSAFGIDPATISSVNSNTAYGPMVTFACSAVDRLRMILFGGASPTWEKSRQAVVQYLKANAAEWESAQ